MSSVDRNNSNNRSGSRIDDDEYDEDMSYYDESGSCNKSFISSASKTGNQFRNSLLGKASDLKRKETNKSNTSRATNN